MTEREIAEVLRAVPTSKCACPAAPNFHRSRCLPIPDYDAMARAVAERVVSQYPCRAQRTADPPQDCGAPFCGCRPAWADAVQMLLECGWGPCADRDARLARLGEALRTVRFTLTALPTLYPQLKASEAVSKAVEIADVALADAGVGKERGDGL